MVTITWHNGEVPKELPVRQVYGLVFTRDGRMLLRIEEKKGKKVHCLAGGTPESFDKDRVATLKRELLEEVNVTIESPIMVGYQLIEGDKDLPPYAQVRMTAIIDEIGPLQPDPDTGETYERLLTTYTRAIELLNWGEVAKLQIEEAYKIATNELGLKVTNEKEELV